MRPASSPSSLPRSGPRWFAPALIAPALIASVAFIAVVAAIDPAGDYPLAPQGPGLTIDESFNVQEGVRLVAGIGGLATGAIAWSELFGDPRDLGPNAVFGYHNPDHPPLGRVWLGLWHNLAASLAPPRNNPGPFITACARVGSAAAFALSVFLCGWAATTWYGGTAGIVAALSLLLMPRVFGHAHLAALESSIGLMYLATVLVVAQTWGSATPPAWKWAAIAGIALGAAMLTKIQAVLIPIPVAVWAIFHWRLRGLLALVIWGGVALAIFFLCWPWLWFHPFDRFLEYLGRTVNRAVLYVWYFGRRYADRDVPWHYPAVMFLTTVPVGLQALGGLGLFGGTTSPWKERHGQLMLGAMLFPLILFSMPRIAVYDGARLFLVVFPLWAIFIGRGGALAWDWLRQRCARRSALVIAACFLGGQSWGLCSVWPCFLGYYNATVGGLRGADRLGLEIDYWGEGMTRDFLEQVVKVVPEGAHIDVTPVLHGLQLDDLMRQSPFLRRRGVHLHADGANPGGRRSDYLLLFRRMADLPPRARELVDHDKPLLEVRREGVLLAALYDRRRP